MKTNSRFSWNVYAISEYDVKNISDTQPRKNMIEHPTHDLTHPYVDQNGVECADVNFGSFSRNEV